MNKPNVATRIAQYAVLVLGSIFALYPIWFIFLASGRPGNRLYSVNLAGMFLPLEWTAENYHIMLYDKPFLQWMKNSLIVAGTTTIFCLFVATSAAFAFSRFRFRGREWGLILFLAIQAFPGVLALVPQAQILGALGLYGSHLGLILAYTSFTLVFCTWNLKGYFDTIPIDLEEAGRIDGCGPVQSFLLIALPLARPALAVTAMFGFFSGWGEYPLASVLIPAPDSMKTVPVGMYSLATDQSVPWGLFAAGALMLLVPLMIVFTYLQQFLEAGLTLGGVKG